MDGSDSSEQTPVAAPAAADTAPPAGDKTADPDDFDAVPAERVDALGRKRENSIPHSRVKEMIARREQKLIATVAKELGISKAEAELKLEDVTGALTERSTKVTDYETRLRDVDTVEAIMANEPERYIQMLAMVNPAYQRFAAVLQQAATAVQQNDDATTRAAADDPMPEPDLDLGDGRKTYSLDGLRKRDEWVERRLTRQLEGKIGERLKPIEDERKAAAERQRVEVIRSQAIERINAQLDVARKWHGFNEHEADILAALKADPKLGLHDAYMQTVMPKLVADRTKMRNELIAELNAQPRSTSVPAPTATAKSSSSGSRSTADIAREVIASLGV